MTKDYQYFLSYGKIKGHEGEEEFNNKIKLAKKIFKKKEHFESLPYDSRIEFWQKEIVSLIDIPEKKKFKDPSKSWGENFESDPHNYFPFNISISIFKKHSDLVDKEGYWKYKPDYTFSVFPKNEDESKIFRERMTEQLIKENPNEYDLETIQNNHLHKIENNWKAIEYIDRQIEKYNKEKDNYKHEREGQYKTFTEGYDSYVEQRQIDFIKNPFALAVFKKTLKGFINAQIVPFLEHQKELLKHSPVNNEIIDNDILEVRTKVILLNHLGIIKQLKNGNLSLQNNTVLSKLITDIIETNESNKKKTFEAVRTDLRYISEGKPKKVPKGKNPYTQTAINKANSILSNYGLPNIEQ